MVNFEHQNEKKWKEQVNQFDFFNNALIIHKDTPLYTCCSDIEYSYNIYAYKEQLEKKYFVFFLKGIDTYFVIKNDAIYAVKMVLKEKNINPKSFDDFLNNLAPEFLDINDYFKNLNIDLIYDKEVAEIIKKIQLSDNLK